MSVTRRTAILAALASILVFFFPLGVMLAALSLIVAAALFDAWMVRTPPQGTRAIGVVARGVPTALHIEVQTTTTASRMEIRQPLPPEVTTIGAASVFADDSRRAAEVDQAEHFGAPTTVRLEQRGTTKYAHVTMQLVVARRGRHTLAPLAVRSTGPLGLGRWQHQLGGSLDLKVFADVHLAHRLARAVRMGLIRNSGQTQRGPLGLGTDFESVREYRPDDDVRQINWGATARIGRAMSNNLRVEQDRDLLVLVDVGRLSGAPFLPQEAEGEAVNEDSSANDSGTSGNASSKRQKTMFTDDLSLSSRHRRKAPTPWETATRLDVQLDTVAALGLVADELGDRCGLVIYAGDIERTIRPLRRGGVSLLSTTFDATGTWEDSDHERAFQSVAGGRRALIIILTDLVDRAAAQPLLRALPILTSRHDVTLMVPFDPVLYVAVNENVSPATVAATKASLPNGELLDSTLAEELTILRKQLVADVRGTGADVVSALPDLLPQEAVRNYVRVRVRPRQKTSTQ
jgi:uncharacterized protein (DUF58 family)